jgi:hypothetical protein
MGKDWDAPWKENGRWTQSEQGQKGRIDGHGGMDTWGARPNFTAGKPFQSWCEQWATECLRVLKPGGHMLAFGGTRTWHRLACAIEDAGFEIRDSIAWLYGSGFPKSLDVSKAIDKAAGAEGAYGEPRSAAHAEMLSRGVARRGTKHEGWDRPWMDDPVAIDKAQRKYEPATDAAKQWQGWGTALKPAFEPVVCARKPFNAVPLDWRLVANVHHAIAGLLWLSLSPAKRAETLSVSSQATSDVLAQCVSARVSAAMGISPDGYAATDTFSSPETESTCLSIASLWSAILAVLSDPMNTSTTSTKSSTTTGLRILNSLLAPITSPTTMPACECLHGGPSSPAPNVASDSNGDWSKWTHTLSASVPESVSYATASAVHNALASIADELSTAQEAASTADPTATTRAASNAARPAFEPVVVARKPLSGTVAANVQAWGTGALNVDGCRVGTGERTNRGMSSLDVMHDDDWQPKEVSHTVAGRWPANVVLDGDMADELDKQSESTRAGKPSGRHSRSNAGVIYGNSSGRGGTGTFGDDDQCGASRFFPTFRYTAKAPGTERPTADGVAHPTVKPLELMRWLVRLVTPPNGVVLDPFAGSGTTGEAAIHEHKRAILIEREPTYLPLIVARLSKPMAVGFDFEGIA